MEMGSRKKAAANKLMPMVVLRKSKPFWSFMEKEIALDDSTNIDVPKVSMLNYGRSLERLYDKT